MTSTTSTTEPVVTLSVDQIKQIRQEARTNLLYLCRRVLNYREVDRKVHAPIIIGLQQFKGGTDEINSDNQLISYKPAIPMYDLPGPRRRLFLDPRGFFKTSVITIAHTIQWIINYPDIRILICHATNERAEEILREIKGQFQYNNVFRGIFPEFCPPPRKAGDFGNNREFIVPNRRRILKEPTVYVSSIDSAVAGTHMEVIKCSDIVEKENVRTPERMRQVQYSFAQLFFLLDQPSKAWVDVEGTCYDHSDIYNKILAREESKKPEDREWQIHRRAIWDTEHTPTWPERFPKKAIESIRDDPNMDAYTFNAQYCNTCINQVDSYFTADQFQWTPTKIIKAMCHRFHVTVDLATVDPLAQKKGTEDFTAIVVAGFDEVNRMYVCDIQRGRFKPSEVIEAIFDVYNRWRPLDIKIEDASGARQIFPMLERERIRRGVWPLLSLIKRDTRVSKAERIAGLQPWFKARDIRFAEELPFRDEMLQEFVYFPRSPHDDITDAIADQMQNRVYFGPNSTEEPSQPKEMDFLGNPWEELEERSAVPAWVDYKTGL